MLVVTRHGIGDKHLSTAEVLQRHWETTKSMEADLYHMSDHEDMKNLRLKSGHMIHSSEFIRRTLSLNPHLVVLQSINFPENHGFYFPFSDKLQYCGALTRGWVPEFTSIIVNSEDNPISYVFGWRTCLVRLLNVGGLEWEQVVREFGDPLGVNALRWKEMTRLHRQNAIIPNL